MAFRFPCCFKMTFFFNCNTKNLKVKRQKPLMDPGQSAVSTTKSKHTLSIPLPQNKLVLCIWELNCVAYFQLLEICKTYSNEKPPAYVATYNKNNPVQFTEIRKNLELKNMDKIKEILDITKIIKSQRQSKNVRKILTFSTFGENTTQGVTKCNNKRCKICDIIIEGKSYTFEKPGNKIQNKWRLKLHNWM